MWDKFVGHQPGALCFVPSTELVPRFYFIEFGFLFKHPP